VFSFALLTDHLDLDARDLAHFKNLLGFTAHESIIAATYGVARLFMRSHEMGQLKPGNFADCILVDGKPLEEIEVLQDHDKLNVIIINGRVHKAGRKEYVAPPIAGQDGNSHPIVPDVDFPQVKKDMQKNY
jgi:imidazolonepropionase-like amidohydrolase